MKRIYVLACMWTPNQELIEPKLLVSFAAFCSNVFALFCLVGRGGRPVTPDRFRPPHEIARNLFLAALFCTSNVSSFL